MYTCTEGRSDQDQQNFDITDTCSVSNIEDRGEERKVQNTKRIFGQSKKVVLSHSPYTIYSRLKAYHGSAKLGPASFYLDGLN